MEHPPKQGLKRQSLATKIFCLRLVLMEHPPKQGLKRQSLATKIFCLRLVLMEHPPKQGLKPVKYPSERPSRLSF